MDELGGALQYALDPRNDFLGKLGAHLQLSGLSLLLAIFFAVPLGIWISRYKVIAQLVTNVVGVIRVVPSIAVLFLLLPLLGIGFAPAFVALTLLAIPPLLINTEAGMRSVDPATVEAGRGLGMSPLQLLQRVQLPLAMPVMLAGLRTAAVEVIASATLAALIGGGGLGEFIATGLSIANNNILLAGAIPVALIALVAERGLAELQKRVSVKRDA